MHNRPSNLQYHESFGFQVNDGPEIWTPNRVVNQGLNYALNAALLGQGTNSNWYIAPFAANVNPAANVTAANFASTLTEFTNYTQGTRPAWNADGAATAMELINDASPALITVGSGAQTSIYGAGLISTSGKGATSGILFSAGLLQAAALLNLAAGFEVRLKYRLTASSASTP